MFRWHVVSAVFQRNVKQYFSGPLGYLFIIVFVTVCAVMAFNQQFFADNLANLNQLSRWYSLLLLFFIPAITMTVWADEKRQGTDSILFTLPASDFDILLGKYLAVAAVYTIALLFSTTQLLALQIIGDPDWGVISTTYVGYWLAGLALLSIGMLASSLTSSATVAFVLGSLLCAIPVMMGHYFRGTVGLERLGIEWNLRDFTIGLIPLSNVAYFVSLTVLMLYMNLIVISKRHWHRGQQLSLGGHYFLRVVSLAVALGAIGYLSSTAISSTGTRLDLTAEKLYTLAPVTLKTLDKIRAEDREVTIQAFISSDVPRLYVDTKTQLLGLLKQFSEYGGGNVTVRYVDVKPNSQEALNAQRSGIEPIDDRSELGGRTVEQKVYLGAHVSTSLDDVTIPFLDTDASLEYELSRAVATTIDSRKRTRLGILVTDAHFAGPEIDGRRPPGWIYSSTMDELKKQFEIKHIQPDELSLYLDPPENPDDPAADQSAEPKRKAPDVLLVAAPSSLSDAAMEELVRYLEAGNPAVILADPLPFFLTWQYPPVGVVNAPNQARISRQSPYRDYFASSPLPKSDNGTASKLLAALGIEWQHDRVAWSLDNPHPNFKGEHALGSWPDGLGPYDKAFVFVRDHGDQVVFNDESILSSGLNELLLFYPGSIQPAEESELEFQPLLELGTDSGTTVWGQLTENLVQKVRMVDPRTGLIRTEERKATSQITRDDLLLLQSNPAGQLDEETHVVGARITGAGEESLDVVFIADLDFVSELYYIQEKALDQKLDNLSLLLNSIEVLAGNEDFVALRNRRAKPRTLDKLEVVLDTFRAQRETQQQEAEQAMQDELEAAQSKLQEAAEEIQANESLNILEKFQKTSQEALGAQRRFDLKEKKLKRELKQRISELQTEEQDQISRVENWMRYSSIFSAPLPALLLGIIVLWIRYLNEQKDITPQRRV